MSEPTNAVLVERLARLENELVQHKKQSREELKAFKDTVKEEFRELHEDMKANEREIATVKSVANEVNTSMFYVKEAVSEMKTLMSGFTKMITEHNKSVDTKMDAQSTKIDSFINSDKRADNKKNFWASVLQVTGYIIVAVLGFMASGKF